MISMPILGVTVINSAREERRLDLGLTGHKEGVRQYCISSAVHAMQILSMQQVLQQAKFGMSSEIGLLI